MCFKTRCGSSGISQFFRKEGEKVGYMHDSILIYHVFFSPFFGNMKVILHFFPFFRKYELFLLLLFYLYVYT